MAIIIPSIIANNFEDFCGKMQKVSSYVSWAHLDVADGVFAPHKTWGNPEEISQCSASASLEVHLMVENPENILDAWLTSGVKRIIYHFESTEAHEKIIRKCKEFNISVFVALRQETSADVLQGIAKHIDGVLLFSGNIGFYGSTFRPDAILPKIHNLHGAFPELTIEVDGGMNPETAPLVVKAGASQIVSGSYIFESGDIAGAIKELQKAAKF